MKALNQADIVIGKNQDVHSLKEIHLLMDIDSVQGNYHGDANRAGNSGGLRPGMCWKAPRILKRTCMVIPIMICFSKTLILRDQ